MKEFFKHLLYEPMYNALIGIINFLPVWADVGIAVIILTILVRLILFPLSIKAVRTQAKMKLLQEPMKELQEKYKNNREELGRKMLEMYRKEGVNPFASILLILIQLPILLTLYFVFSHSGLPVVNMDLLYSFMHVPETLNMHFLGLIDIAAPKNVLLSLIAAATQYFQIRFAMPVIPPKVKNPTLKDDLARNMSLQMRYIMPIITFFISYSLVSVIAVYWIISNLFSIGQEIYVRKHIHNVSDKSPEKLPA